MHIYIAGKMRGVKDFNFPAFNEAAATLRKLGHTVFNPAERDIRKYGENALKSPTGNLGTIERKGFSLRDALGADLAYICKTAEAVVMLPGWEDSKGAKAEKATAHALDIPVYFYKDMPK